MNKTAIVIILVIVIGGGGYYLYSSYSSLEVSLDGVSIESIGLTSATLNLNIRIVNPSQIPLTVSSTRFDIYIEGQHVGTGSSAATGIGANSQGSLQAPVTLSYVDLSVGMIDVITQGGSADVTVSGEAKVYFISIPFQFTETVDFF